MTAADRSYSAGRWLRCPVLRPDASVRLVCFPHAGGSATFFRSWGRQVTLGVEVLAVQYPGRLDRLREPCIEDVHELADAVASALGCRLDRPVALLGHSLGAVVAYETANRLAAGGIALRALFVSSHPAPGRGRAPSPQCLSDGPLLADLRRLGATPAGVMDQPELTDVVLPSLRSDYRAAGRYRPRPVPPLTCPVIALVGDNDPDVSVEEMRPWAQVTDGPFFLHQLPGDHFYLMPRLDQVVDEVERHLGINGHLVPSAGAAGED